MRVPFCVLPCSPLTPGEEPAAKRARARPRAQRISTRTVNRRQRTLSCRVARGGMSEQPPSKNKTFGKTFGKRSRPVVVHGDDPAELRQLPPPAPVSKKGPAVKGTGRLGRQDLGIACSLMDDLQYALDGLASASVPVRRRSAVKVLDICLDPKAAAARITLSAALVVSAIREVRSRDALLSLAFAAVLRTIALDEICSDDVLQDLVLSPMFGISDRASKFR